MEVEFNGTHTKKNNLVKKNCEEDRQETSKIIKDFGAYTTLHGFHFIFDSGSLLRKVIWVLLLVLGLSFLFLQFRDNYRKLRNHSSVISREIELNDTIPFPAVSICNQNMMRRSRIMGTDAQIFLDQQDPLKIQLMGHKVFENEITDSFDVEQSVRTNGHKLSEMLKMCSWKKAPCTAENFTSFLTFKRGLCYTFNSGQSGQPELYVTTPGKIQALSLYLDAQPEEYYGPYSYDATGFKVLIHEQRDLYPNIEDYAIDISPGFTTNVRVRRKKMKRLPPPYRSGCGEKNLTTFSQYSEPACLLECYTKITVNACNCRLLSMPSLDMHNKTRFCTANELFGCLFPLFGDFNPNRCGCPASCEQIYYEVQTSMAYCPSDHLWDAIFVLYNVSVNDMKKAKEFQTYIRKRMAHVNIYYESLETEVTEEKPAYDLNDFGSDVGGNMGLFLGCSLLTLCEFVDLLVIMCLRFWRKRNGVALIQKNGHNINPPVQYAMSER